MADPNQTSFALFRMRRIVPLFWVGVFWGVVGLTAVVVLGGCAAQPAGAEGTSAGGTPVARASAAVVAEARAVFRFDTFGDEQLWTDTLRLYEVIEKSVDPTTALTVGLKVDADVLPAGILAKVDLTSRATTAALLKMNAIVGVQATVDANNRLTRTARTRRS